MITLQNWLADRKRKYADGLALFQALAPEEMRKKYIAFFSEVKVPQFDSHFTVLVNKLTTVAPSSAQPQITISERGSILLKTAVAATKAIEKTANQLKGDKVLKEILVKESELFKLQDKITELEEDNDDKSERSINCKPSWRKRRKSCKNCKINSPCYGPERRSPRTPPFRITSVRSSTRSARITPFVRRLIHGDAERGPYSGATQADRRSGT